MSWVVIAVIAWIVLMASLRLLVARIGRAPGP
jgi:uncharacterized membrane protein